MVPREGALEDEDVVLAEDDTGILLGRTARDVHEAVMRREKRSRSRAPRRVHENQRYGGDRQFFPAGAALDTVVADPSALAGS